MITSTSSLIPINDILQQSKKPTLQESQKQLVAEIAASKKSQVPGVEPNEKAKDATRQTAVDIFA